MPSFSSPSPRPRLSWLDYFRGAAVILMMETHVAHTFLDTDLRAAPWFEWLDYANGLVAPSFLFIAGFTQGGRWQGGQGKPLSLEGRARRLAGIALLGYGLHFPFSQLWNAEWSEALRLGTQIDVLQCLAVSLFVLLLVTLGAQRLAPPWRGEVWWRVLGALALAVILAAPSVAEWEGGSLPVRALINHSTGSLFPLFSWSAFVFCGALCGEMASRPILVRIGATAAVMALGQILPSLTFSAVSPQFFLERLGWVMMLALFCEWLVPDQASSWVSFAGRESLIMYVGHLTLIFLLATIGLPERELSWPATLGWMGVVMAVTFGLAFAKSRWGAWAEGLVSA